MKASLFPRGATTVLVLVLSASAAWSQQVKIEPGSGGLYDQFGISAAISGDGNVAVIGASRDDEKGSESGAAYVFERSGTAWTLAAKLTQPAVSDSSYFGIDVAIDADGSTIVVGASWADDVGKAYVYERKGTAYSRIAELEASDAAVQDRFGGAVSISQDGTRILVGASGNDVDDSWSGSAYVFARRGAGWAEEAVLLSNHSTFQHFFGYDVALSGDGQFALVSGPSIGGEEDVHVFVRSDTIWTEQARLEHPFPASHLSFATSVATDSAGARAFVGSTWDDELGLAAGTVHVFERSGTAWSHTATLFADDAAEHDALGTSVATNSDGTVVVSGARETNAHGPGSAYVFELTGSTWVQHRKLVAYDADSTDGFGHAVSLSADGNRALIGSPNDEILGVRSGSVYAIERKPPPPPDASFVLTLGGPGFDDGIDVGVDGDRNSYFIGEFDGQYDFDPGVGTAMLSSTRRDVYVVSYDAAGALRFAFHLGNGYASSEAAGGLAVSEAGYFAVTGNIPFGEVDFDPDPGSEWLVFGAFFVAGYHPDGSVQFAIAASPMNAMSSAVGRDVALGRSRSVYVTGGFNGTVDFEYTPALTARESNTPQPVAPNIRTGPATSVPLVSSGGSDAFVAGYSPSGNLRFAFRLGSIEEDGGNALAVDRQENVFVTGHFRGEVEFDRTDSNGDGNPEPRSSGANRSAFLAGYSAQGVFRFAIPLGEDAVGEDVAVDTAGNVFVVGTFAGTMDFDPFDSDGDGDLQQRTESAGGSAFLASYTGDGVFRYAVVPEGSSTGLALATRPDGATALSGDFAGTIDFDPFSAKGSFTGLRGRHSYVATFEPSGAFSGAFHLPGSGLDAGHGIAVDASGNVLLTGRFTGETDFDPGAAVDMRTSGGQTDLYLAKFLPVRLTVAVEEAPEHPATDRLTAAYPNPFDAFTTLQLHVDRPQQVRVAVYDVLGRRIAILHEGAVQAGQVLDVRWDPGDAAAGVYLIRAEGDTFKATRRVVRVH